MKKLKVLVGVTIIFVSIITSGCAETVLLEEYDAKVTEYENTISELETNHVAELSLKDSEISALESEIDSLESNLSQANSDYSDLEDDLESSKQETNTAIDETVNLQSQIDKLKLYSELAYGVWKGPPAGSSDLEYELYYGPLGEIVYDINDETLFEFYDNFMLRVQSLIEFNELYNYIFFAILGE